MSTLKPRLIQYELSGGWTLLVGATDADNDLLSTTVAAPEDWWLHAEGVPGSHVILRTKPGEEPADETLRQAAAVAAYHSKARAAGTARVYCTRARHVTKPRGVKAGTVKVSRGTVLKVRPDNGFATRVRMKAGDLPIAYKSLPEKAPLGEEKTGKDLVKVRASGHQGARMCAPPGKDGGNGQAVAAPLLLL